MHDFMTNTSVGLLGGSLPGPKGSRNNNFPCLGVDPSCLAALLVLSIRGSMHSPRALPDRRLTTQSGEVIIVQAHRFFSVKGQKN